MTAWRKYRIHGEANKTPLGAIPQIGKSPEFKAQMTRFIDSSTIVKTLGIGGYDDYLAALVGGLFGQMQIALNALDVAAAAHSGRCGLRRRSDAARRSCRGARVGFGMQYAWPRRCEPGPAATIRSHASNSPHWSAANANVAIICSANRAGNRVPPHSRPTS
jgi:hypothetical protein